MPKPNSYPEDNANITLNRLNLQIVLRRSEDQLKCLHNAEMSSLWFKTEIGPHKDSNTNPSPHTQIGYCVWIQLVVCYYYTHHEDYSLQGSLGNFGAGQSHRLCIV